ncbi:hypothetical protein JR316_0003669 [Psilocybe cubensis]|uniref:Uncharacterized protein n=2 Tax=Psilocybe cubensis TaxID=181762 RepID=A0A8H8CNB1_PSICU|nr:hypothetical protein JR316_0003669 [Psilocybe cubensis]KAH9484189.1 hypothetical protein JR316_0003669 [Psilocybe cubensis]
MSAMLETFDMPMHDYQNDLDIQMHPSSDQWFPDEAQMEEDGPGGTMKPENYSPPKGDNISQMKTDAYSQEKAEITIEVDMEPFLEHHNGAEYDMEADEDIHHTGGENLDVEVYDVSVAQSPLMIAGEIVQDGPSNFVGSFDHTEPATLSHHSSPSIAHISDLPPLEPEIHENSSLHDVSVESHDFLPDSAPEVQAPEVISDPIVEQENSVPSSEAFLDPHIPEERAPDIPLPPEVTHISELPGTVADAPEAQEDVNDDYNKAPTLGDHADIETSTTVENALGDPHEISEGVYIDPPPPVLLSVSTEDHFDWFLFNESPVANTSSQSDGQSNQAGLVLLHHFPTLYYEPLSAVFDALRLDENIQSMFHLSESELILDAVDLQLTLREDNIYAREVSIHDLNVLHDVSGIHGQLRMRLSASTPRFLTRYQYLQEHVSQLNLEPASDMPLAEIVESNITEEAPAEENREAQVNENADEEQVEEDIETRAEDQSEELVQTKNMQDNAQEQGNQDDGRTEVDTQTHTTESYNPETDLPPLPAEDEEEDGEVEENTSPVPDHYDSTFAMGGTLDMSQRPPGLETEVEQPHDFNANAISLEALEGPVTNSHESGDGEDGVRRIQEQDGNQLDGEGEEENSVVAGEDEDGDDEDYQTIGDSQELEHQGHLEGEYEYQENAEEEYAEEEPAADDHNEYYQESDTTHFVEDHLDYVEEEEGSATLQIQSVDAPLAGFSEFDIVHPNTDENGADESSVGPDSHHEQGSTEETLDDGVAYTSQLNTSERDCNNSETDPTDQISAKPETKPETTSLEVGQDGQLESFSVLEKETDLESILNPNVEESFAWEDDFDGDGDPETPLEGDNEDAPSRSNHSSVTLSSKASKRSFDDFEFEEGYEDNEGHWSPPPSSPDPKRTRTH